MRAGVYREAVITEQPGAEQSWISEDAGIAELLGVAAAASLAAFERGAVEATKAPTFSARLRLARLAAARFVQMGQVEAELARSGVGLEQAMRSFASAMDDFHDHTDPRTWPEVLLKLVLTDGLVHDLASAVAGQLPSHVAGMVFGSDLDVELARFPGTELRTVLATEPGVVDRLSLYGRRLVGEAIAQGQRIAARHGALTSLLTGFPSEPGEDLAAISDLMADLVRLSSARLASYGLQS